VERVPGRLLVGTGDHLALLRLRHVAVLQFELPVAYVRLGQRQWSVLTGRGSDVMPDRLCRYALVLAALSGAIACGGRVGAIATNEIQDDGGAGVAGADASGAGFPGSGGAAGTGGIAGAGGLAGAGGQGGSAGAPTTCNPGDTRNVGSCSKCGTKQETCDNTGNWGAAQCVGQGACTPGHTQNQSCDDCGDTQTRTCDNSCKWGAYSKCPGACNWKQGSHWRCCAAGSWEYCLSTCHWSGNCASSSSASCCTGAGPSC